MDGLSVPVKETLGATGPQQVRWHLKLFNHFQSCPHTLYQAYNLKLCYQSRNYNWDEFVEIHYIHFHCYMHRRHLSTCYEPGLHPQTPLRSNSTFSHKRWIYFDTKLSLGVSRSHSVRDKLTVFNVTSFEYNTYQWPNSTRSHH